LKKGFLPVVSSVGSDSKGEAVNINADDAASALACSINAEHLIFLTDIAGVMDRFKKTIPFLKSNDINHLIEGGVITGGMIPKVQSARAALDKGVGEVDIVDGYKGISITNGTRIIP
jgi:acetylglutamate kinase